MQTPYCDLANAAVVALRAVDWAPKDLREYGFLADFGGERQWVDRKRVLQTWTINSPLHLRERLHIRRFVAKEDPWWLKAKPETFGGYWGGEMAAANLNGDLVPKTITVYLPEDRKEFLAEHRLRAGPQDPVEGIEYLIPGGMAREIMLSYVHGCDAGHVTMDVDFWVTLPSPANR